MENCIEILRGKVICMNVFKGFIPGPNDKINEEKEFEKIVIRKNRPLIVIRGENKLPEKYTRFVKKITENEDGNLTLETMAAVYLIKVH